MSDIAIMLIGIATIINSINLFITAKRLKEDEDAIVRLLKGLEECMCKQAWKGRSE